MNEKCSTKSKASHLHRDLLAGISPGVPRGLSPCPVLPNLFASESDSSLFLDKRRIRSADPNSMFEDLIPMEDNHILKLSKPNYREFSSVTLDLKWVESHAEWVLSILFSKESPIVQSIIGGSSAGSLKSSYFYNHFPRKASNLDGEHHYIGVDLEMGRWIPAAISEQILPKKLQTFTAYPVPTLEELALCKERNGRAFWTENGIWTCNCDTNRGRMAQGKTFDKYEEYVSWRRESGSS